MSGTVLSSKEPKVLRCGPPLWSWLKLTFQVRLAHRENYVAFKDSETCVRICCPERLFSSGRTRQTQYVYINEPAGLMHSAGLI